MSGTENLDLTKPVVLPVRSCRRDTLPNTDGRRQMCYRCPSCIQMRNISEFSSERTPLLAGSMTLLRDSRCCDKILIYLLISILLFGTGIGIYLLILESKGIVIDEFDYVSRENWGLNSTFLKDIPPLHKPASKIRLLNVTSNCSDVTKICLNYEEFSDHHKGKLPIFSGKILYNFYQDQEGKIFEGRGWNFQSDCGKREGCDDTLTIGLLEESSGVRSSRQVQKLKAFLDYCVMIYVLKPCYEIVRQYSRNRGFEDLAFALDKMNRKGGTCQYFT